MRMRERAREMRRAGRSIRDITAALHASKSSVSYWCRDIILTPPQQRRLNAAQSRAAMTALLKASEKKRAARLRATDIAMKLGAREVGKLSRRDIAMIGLALYWGEGYKRGNEELGFTNSNESIIRMFIRWMRQEYPVRPSDFILRVSINGLHKSRIDSVTRYWAEVTNLPISQFTSPSFIKTANKKVYLNAHEHYGTLRIKVRRATALRRRILGSLREIARQC